MKEDKKTGNCRYNEGVICDKRACLRCGFHPDVEARRKAAIHAAVQAGTFRWKRGAKK